jgi:hypothetical protein
MDRDICSYCQSEIDPETCHCGTAVADHGIYDGHSPVPMGCTCHLKIEIIEADRPVDDTPENWRKIVSNALRDEYRQNRFGDDDFVECDVCAAKPGTPALCAGCLANRETIGRLRSLRRGR